MGNHLRLWVTVLELDRIRQEALYESSAKAFGMFCIQYIWRSLLRLRIADEVATFVKCLIA
jgi:hypothetical protein